MCELFYSGAWQTAPAYVRDKTSITRGRGNETSEPTPQTLSGTLDNRSGAYNPRNASSPLYGLVGRNTPQREGLDLAVDSFGGTSASGWTPTDGGLPWTGLGAAAADFTESGGLGRHLQPLKNIVRVSLLAEERRDVEQVTEASIPAVALGASAVLGHVARRQTSGDYYWLRLEFDVGGAVTAKISKTISGSFTELASRSGIPGLTYTAGQSYTIRSSVSGSRLSLRVWPAGTPEPSAWTLTDVDSSITAAGRYGLASWVVSGNTNTTEVRFDNYRAVDRRFFGEVASWKPGRTVEFNPATGRGDAWTEVEAAGILRRLGQGADPLDSPLRRAILATNPSGYWPLEDGDGSLSARSAVAGVADMQPFGYSRFTAPGTGAPVPAANLPKFGTGGGIPGSAPVADLAQGGVLQADLPYAQFAGWRLEWVARFPRDKAGAVVPLRWETDGSWGVWDFQVDASGIFATFYVSDPLGPTAGSASASLNLFDGLPHHFQIEAFDTGGTADVRIYVDDVQVATYRSGGVAPSGTTGSITQVIVNPLEINANDAAAESMPVLGHVAVWNPSVGLSTAAVAMLGHAGETAGARFLRLCGEEGVPATVVGDVASTEPMGPQRTGVDLAGQLAEIERTEAGIIYEPRDGLGLVLRAVDDLYNQARALTVDWSAYQVAPPFAPVVDDQGTRNDVTAKSTTGGEARAVLEVGPMSVLPPPVGVGRYSTKLDVNPYADARLVDLAGWALRRGTVDEVRVSRVTVDLVGSPGLAAAAAAVDVGDRIVVTGMPADMGSNEVSLIVLGYTEVIGSHTRTITFNCVPASPYDVALVDGTQRVAADGSTLAADLTAGGTSLLLASTAENRPWTQDPADMPLDVRVGGERVTASAIAPAVADVFSRTVSNGWGTANSGQAWTTTGGSASDYSVSGATGQHVHNGVGVLHQAFIAPGGSSNFTMVTDVTIPVMPTGAAITVWVVIREVDTSNYYTAQLGISPGGAATLTWFKRVAGSISSLASGVNVGTHTAGASWRISAAIFGTTLMAKAWLLSASDPGWQATATDTAITAGTQVGVLSRLETGNTNTLPVTVSVDNFTVVNPQTVTLSARAVNGVARAWPAGTEVDVWQPAVVPL